MVQAAVENLSDLDLTVLLDTLVVHRDVSTLLELSDAPLDRIREALAAGSTAPSVALAGIRLRAPVLQPPTVRDFLDFEAHAGRARYLQPGDVVDLEVEGIGVLRHTVAPKRNPDPNYRYRVLAAAPATPGGPR